MKRRLFLTRRGFWRLLAGVAACAIAPEGRLWAAPSDQGIGGTGAAPEVENGDRGIGGTGVIGTIRKFGSIYVNDLRIAYPGNATVRIDGYPAKVSDLKVGQVVRVVALRSDGAYSTHEIDVSSEAVGVVRSISSSQISVLGQTILIDGLPAADRRVRVGDFVAVYGLRRPDGTIVASLVSKRPAGGERLAGPVLRTRGGALSIGGAPVSGLDPRYIGQRVVTTGRMVGNRFIVGTQESEVSLLRRSGVENYVIEAYVGRRDGGLAVGSGLPIVGSYPGAPSSRVVRAVLSARLEQTGVFAVQSFRPIAGVEDLRGIGRGPGGFAPKPGGRAGPGRPFRPGRGFGPGEPGGRRFRFEPGLRNRGGSAPFRRQPAGRSGGPFRGQFGRGGFRRRDDFLNPGGGLLGPGGFGGRR